jgi:hypothetical protein
MRRRQRERVLICLLCAAAIPGAPAGGLAQSADLRVVLDDVRNFVDAYERLETSPDTVAALQTHYLDRGTPGLQAFMEKFPFTAEELAQAVRANAADYGGLSQRLAWLQSMRESIAQAGDSLARLGTGASPLPVYLVVGAHNDVASGSKAGALVTVEVGAARAEKSNLLPLAMHELTHVYQFSTIGMERYQTIYNDRKTLLALTLREGIADFLAKLVTGRTTQERAHAFLTENRSRMWEAFVADMCGEETGDWMWRRPSDPNQPSYVAYALGAEIAESYYDREPDKRRAIAAMIAIDDYPAFLLASGYPVARGTSAQDMEAALVTCRSK